MTHVAVSKQQQLWMTLTWVLICSKIIFTKKKTCRYYLFFIKKSLCDSVYPVINAHSAEFTGLPVVVAVDIFPY